MNTARQTLDRDSIESLDIWRYTANPGEGCIECDRPIESAGLYRIGACLYHLGYPDIVCDDCAARLRPDLVLQLARNEVAGALIPFDEREDDNDWRGFLFPHVWGERL